MIPQFWTAFMRDKADVSLMKTQINACLQQQKNFRAVQQKDGKIGNHNFQILNL